VVLLDSSTSALPAALALWWPGCSAGTAALKLHVRYDLWRGQLNGVLVQEGRISDRSTMMQTAPLPRGALRISERGVFTRGVCAAMTAQGVYWLSRLAPGTAVYTQDGARWDVLDLLAAAGTPTVERDVTLGVTLGVDQRLPARLLAVRVPEEVSNQRRRRVRAEGARPARPNSRGPTRVAQLAWCDWTIVVTSVPSTLLTLREALVLLRARWQIELLFKLWKSHGHIDASRREQPWRVLCEVFAKLLAMVVQHWLLLVSCWTFPDRSLLKAAQTIRQHALSIASALACPAFLDHALAVVQRCVAAGCRLNRRNKNPNTYQLLLEPSLAGLT